MRSLEDILAKEQAGDFDVFLCHNSEDKPVIRWVAEQLRERGILPWLDEDELPPGRSWQEELERKYSEVAWWAGSPVVPADGVRHVVRGA